MLGNVRKLPGVEKNLLVCRKDELSSALDTLQDTIREFHFRLPKSGEVHRNRLVSNKLAGPGSLFFRF